MGRGVKITWNAYSAVLDWLDYPSKFKLITGRTNSSKVVAGKMLKKVDA